MQPTEENIGKKSFSCWIRQKFLRAKYAENWTKLNTCSSKDAKKMNKLATDRKKKFLQNLSLKDLY